MAGGDEGREQSTGQRWLPRAYALLLAAYLLLVALKVGYDRHETPRWSWVAGALVVAIVAGPGGLLVRKVWRATAVGAPRRADEPPRMVWGDFIAGWVFLVGFILYAADSLLDLGFLSARAR
jgi:hypothetical protein